MNGVTEFRRKRHRPLGDDGGWKTGQRVEVPGVYRSQTGEVRHFAYLGSVSTPTRNRNDEMICASWHLVSRLAAA